MNRFSKSYLRRSMWEFWVWALTSLKITSFYPDTFWLGLKSQVGNNIRFWEVVLPLSSSAISIAGGMLYLQVLWDFPFVFRVLVFIPCALWALSIWKRTSPIIQVSICVDFIFHAFDFQVFFFYSLQIPFFSLMGQCCGCSMSVPKLWLGLFQASASFSWLLFPQMSGNLWLMLKGWEL